MDVIEVRVGRGYEYRIGKNLSEDYVAHLPACRAGAKKAQRVMIVSDDNVFPLYGERTVKSFSALFVSVDSYVFAAGERSKNLRTVEALLERLSCGGFDRNDLIVALGGGVVGDLAGFAASVYMRGIKVIQLPTTLLAAVDSSIGGKTGVDFNGVKNSIGTFWQPTCVLFDTETIKTLSDECFHDGFCEVLKYAILCGGELFELLKNGLTAGNLERCIRLCVAEKARLVAEDERESGSRTLLNLGHTYAHAVEEESHYEISHGRAVGAGLFAICEASCRAGLLGEAQYGEITELLQKYGVEKFSDYPTAVLVERMKNDKKSDGEKLKLVIVRAVGRCEILAIEKSELGNFFLTE